MVRREILDVLAFCYHALALELEPRVLTLIDRIREILERMSERVRDFAGTLREIPESRELAPEPIPVRTDR